MFAKGAKNYRYTIAKPPPPPPLGRRTDAVTLLLTSDNGSVLWRRHRQLYAGYNLQRRINHHISLSLFRPFSLFL